MYNFFEELIKEQGDTEIMLRQLQLDQRIRKDIDKNRREIEQRLYSTVQEYHKYAHTNDVLTYLKNFCYYVKF